MKKLLENSDSYAALLNTPSIVLDTGEVISPREWKLRFDTEWYNGDRYGEFQIITSEEGQKEATRNNNSNSRDVLNVAEKTKMLDELDDNQNEFMNDASDAWEWKDSYCVAGPEGAKNTIFAHAKRDIENGSLDRALTRFYISMSNLKTLMRREKRKDR